MSSDEPQVDNREFFLNREKIKTTLLQKKAELVLLEKAQEEKEGAKVGLPEDNKGVRREGAVDLVEKKEEGPLSPPSTPVVLELSEKEVEEEADVVEEKVGDSKTLLEKLKKEVDHLEVLVGFIDSHYSSTCVLSFACSILSSSLF